VVAEGPVQQEGENEDDGCDEKEGKKRHGVPQNESASR
jgi:hypothetical protein